MNNIEYTLRVIKRYFVNLGSALLGRVTREQIQVGKALAEVWDLYLEETKKNEAKPKKAAVKKTAPAKKAPAKKTSGK
jgi:hypothetical protein